MKHWPLILLLALASCSTPAKVTPMADVRPARQSNQETIKSIKSTRKDIKDIKDSAKSESDHLKKADDMLTKLLDE